MPVIEVWGLPEQTETELHALYAGIVDSVISVEELELMHENQMTIQFPLSMMQRGRGSEIIIKTWGLMRTSMRSAEVRLLLAERLGRRVSGFFPEAKVESFVLGWNGAEDKLWETDGFQNPTGNWSYEGPFIAHLTKDADVSCLKAMYGVVVRGQTVKMGFSPRHPGRVTQGVGNVQLYVGEQPVCWGYDHVKQYTRPDGSLIWRNRSFEKME